MTPRVKLYLAQESRREGVTPDEVMARGKKRAVTRARRRVVVRLIDDGFRLSQIAMWLNRPGNQIQYYSQGTA